MTGDAPRPLRGMTVVVVREDPGALETMLTAEGAVMLHMPLIATADPDDGGAALRAELDRLDQYDWLVVSSAHGADRVGPAAAGSSVRLAAVGRATADRLAELSGRPVDLIPSTQTARALAAELAAVLGGSGRVLVAAADRSEGRLEADLRATGVDVTSVVAYRTVLRSPAPDVVAQVLRAADAVLLSSGSTVESWGNIAGAEGFAGPILAIGPSTAAAAERVGVPIAAVADEHSLRGLVEALVALVAAPGERVQKESLRPICGSADVAESVDGEDKGVTWSDAADSAD